MLKEIAVLLANVDHILVSSSWLVEFTAELTAFVLLLSFIGLANLENRYPKIKRPISKTRQSYRTNIALFLVNSIFMSLCSVSTLFYIAERFSGHGLLNSIDNIWVRGLLALLAMDLVLYVWHYSCHKFEILWQVHRVHHNDPYLNVSTAFRLHFVELLFTNLLKALVIVGLGIDKMLMLLIETIITMSIMFHHTNIAFYGERVLAQFFIVPHLHRLHHSVERTEHDNNYGALLSLWDRLFKTLSERQPEVIGIKGDSPLDLTGLIKFGFGLHTPEPALPLEIDKMIAEAAYYRAQNRCFHPGNDLGDWYAARTDILARYHSVNRQKRAGSNSVRNAILSFKQAFKQDSFRNFLQI